MRTARCIVCDGTLAVGAETGLLLRGFFLGTAQLVYELHKEENAQRHQQEINYGLNEIAD